MAFEQPGFSYSRVAAADLSASQFCAVVIDSAGKAALPAGSTVPIAGVLQNKPVAAAEASIVADGITKVIFSGTVAAGDHVMVDSAGKFKTAATTGNVRVGVCLLGGASGETGSVLLLYRGLVP